MAAARAFRSPATGRLVPPSKSCLHRVLSEVDPDALDEAVRRFAAAGRPAGGAIALDGGEILGVRRLLRGIGVAGRVVTRTPCAPARTPPG